MLNKNSYNKLYIDIIFYIFIAIYIAIAFKLIWAIPYTFPFGGPDELMHRSMAEYIANHLSWPNWDSKEIIRNAYGVSYSTGSSIVYWLHGLTYKFFAYHRFGSFILFCLYLIISIFLYRKNRLAGIFLIAGLLPQTIFVFSYVNSDVGTIISALLLGLSVGLFIVKDYDKKYFLILFFFAGFAITSRQHLWAMAFITLVWAIIYKYKSIKVFNKKTWALAILIGFIPASWWFITSYFANEGDILGVFTNAKSIAMFSQSGLPSLGREWSQFSLYNFLVATLISLYANWGWLSLATDSYFYYIALFLYLLVFYFIYKYVNRRVFLFIFFIIFMNFLFMVVYSTFYDYQAQGRYLFPSLYIVFGIVAVIFIVKKISSKTFLYLLIFINILNIVVSSKLLITSYLYFEKPKAVNYKIENYYKNVALNIDQFRFFDNKLFIRGWIYDKNNTKPFNKLSLILKSKKNMYEIELNKEKRADVADAFKVKKLKDSGFSAKFIDISNIKKGEYECIFKADKKFIKSNKKFKL